LFLLQSNFFYFNKPTICQQQGVQAHPQKFLFVENLGKIPENLNKIPKYLGHNPENLVKNGAQHLQ